MATKKKKTAAVVVPIPTRPKLKPYATVTVPARTPVGIKLDAAADRLRARAARRRRVRTPRPPLRVRLARLEQLPAQLLELQRTVERLLLTRQASVNGLSERINAELISENQALSRLVALMRQVLIEHNLLGGPPTSPVLR